MLLILGSSIGPGTRPAPWHPVECRFIEHVGATTMLRLRRPVHSSGTPCGCHVWCHAFSRRQFPQIFHHSCSLQCLVKYSGQMLIASRIRMETIDADVFRMVRQVIAVCVEVN